MTLFFTSMTEPLFLLDPSHDNSPVNCDEFHTGWKLSLPSHIRKHAIQVMRLKKGDRLQLSDGRGLRIHASIQDPQSGLVEVVAVGKEPRPIISTVLVQALAKSGHDEQAVDMATQVGVDAVIPWQADRSIAKWKNEKTGRKWDNLLDSASEQSRRAWRPELQACMSSRQLAVYCQEESARGNVVILLHQDALHSWPEIRTQLEHLVRLGHEYRVSVIVGPEGGVSEAEAASFVEAGAKATRLGNNILRASTAGPLALAAMSDVLGRFDG